MKGKRESVEESKGREVMSKLERGESGVGVEKDSKGMENLEVVKQVECSIELKVPKVSIE